MDRTSEFSKSDIEDNKGIAAFAYFGILFAAPLLAAGDSPFARFHANQGAVLMLDEIILCVFILASGILAGTVSSMFRYVTFFLCVFLFGGMLFCVLFGLINTLKGKAKELPLIGKTVIFK